MKTIIISALALATFGASAVMASERCTVPMKDWQPREALQSKLEAEGWKVRRIKIDDGCYEAKVINAEGHDVEATFNPETLAVIKLERED